MKKELKGAIIGISIFAGLLFLVSGVKVYMEYGVVEDNEFNALLNYFCLHMERYTDGGRRITKSLFQNEGRCQKDFITR